MPSCTNWKNMDLACVSATKIAQRLSGAESLRGPFDGRTLKTQYSNKLVVDRFFAVYTSIISSTKNHPVIQRPFKMAKSLLKTVPDLRKQNFFSFYTNYRQNCLRVSPVIVGRTD